MTPTSFHCDHKAGTAAFGGKDTHPSDLSLQSLHALWLILREQGGWWTLEMLAPHWKPTSILYEAEYAMDALEAGGYVESRNQSSSLAYSVTTGCKIPFDCDHVFQFSDLGPTAISGVDKA